MTGSNSSLDSTKIYKLSFKVVWALMPQNAKHERLLVFLLLFCAQVYRPRDQFVPQHFCWSHLLDFER
jgi:hypothetical protein